MEPLEHSIRIAATPAHVWELVSDVRRMPEWSPQVTSTRLRDGHELGAGAEFTNLNRHGELAWTTHGRIQRFEPERELSFRIEENWAVWSFHLEPDGDGTVLTERRTTPEDISPLSLELTEGFLGGVESFNGVLDEGIRATLEAIRTTAESVDAAVSAPPAGRPG